MDSVSPAVPPPPSVISSRVTEETAQKAVDALLRWNKSKSKDQKPQLLEQDDFFYLVLTLKKIPPTGRTNPYKIPLPHSLHPSDSTEERCLIIDDRSNSSLSSESAKKKIKSENIPITKVLKLSKLKTDYRAFEAKRKLCGSYDMFFADKRVIPLLPKLLGKEFFKKKKIPVPIDLTHKNWKEQIDFSSSSALLYLRTGTCSVIKVARVSMEPNEVVENVFAAIEGVAEIVPKKWGNIRSLHIKLYESLALPVYQSVPDLGMKIQGVQEMEESKDGELVEDGEDKKENVVKKKGSKKGRIHEVNYMDIELGEALNDLSDENDGEVNEKGKKRNSAGGLKKEIDEPSDEKKLKKAVKVKKGDVTKMKGQEIADNIVVSEISDSVGLKKKNKVSKTIKSESGEVKNSTKKTKKAKAQK